ncbi:hypothetical protein V3W47_17150 [Deinococcus sp. YIM 134068]|uniref:hypothetical protein n=1 Tax=Deinococcus lichenicola TaxID=3118910 RepID=UPI002F959477
MKANSKNRTALLALVASLPLTAGLVFAQQAAPQRVQPAQPGQSSAQPGTAPTRQTSTTNYGDVYLQRLAAQLGVSVERLRAAAVAAGNATIDQAVRNGDLAQNRAADLKNRLQNAPLNFGRFGGPAGQGRGDFDNGRGALNAPNAQTQERGTRGSLGQAISAAVARTLGLSEQALFQQLQSGQTVRQLAQAKGVSTQAVHNAAVAALRTTLTAEVRAGRLSQAQAQQLLTRAQADANFGLDFGGRRNAPTRDGQTTPRNFNN